MDTTEYITRWNIKLDTLLLIRRNFNTIEKILETAQEEYRFHRIEKYVLNRLILFLHSFKTVTLFFEGEKRLSTHLVLLHMHTLNKKLIKLQNEDTTTEVQTVTRYYWIMFLILNFNQLYS